MQQKFPSFGGVPREDLLVMGRGGGRSRQDFLSTRAGWLAGIENIEDRQKNPRHSPSLEGCPHEDLLVMGRGGRQKIRKQKQKEK